MLHAALLPLMLVAGPTQTTLYHQPEAQHLQQPMRMARSRLPHLLRRCLSTTCRPSGATAPIWTMPAIWRSTRLPSGTRTPSGPRKPSASTGSSPPPGSRTPISAPATSRSAGSRTASPTSPITASTAISHTRGDQIAIIWEGDDPAESKTITYRELHAEVCRIANVMRNRGVEKGDRVTIYLPMIPEAAYAMLACARLGAIHSVVFGGFSPDSLASRIQDAKSAFVITADEGLRGGRKVPLKANVDAAIERVGAACVDHVLVVRRTGSPVNMVPGRDVYYDEAAEQVSDECPVRGDERGGSALHPLHLGLDRHAEGRAAHHRRLSRLRGDDAPIRVRLPRRRHLLVHGRCGLGDRPLLHPLRPARERRDDPDVRGRADLSVDLPLLGGDRQAQGQHLLHRPDRDPLAHAGGRGAGEADLAQVPAPARARSASRSIRKPGNGTIAWSATTAARSSTPGGRRRPAAS